MLTFQKGSLAECNFLLNVTQWNGAVAVWFNSPQGGELNVTQWNGVVVLYLNSLQGGDFKCHTLWDGAVVVF